MISNIIPSLMSNFGAIDCAPKSFLGLKPWYQYLNVKAVTVNSPDGTTSQVCQFTNFDGSSAQILGQHSPFLLITLAIVDDLLRIAALVAVAFVVVGGFQYITSQGAPDMTKKAQQTIINALIGLVVAILAASIVAFIGGKLAG